MLEEYRKYCEHAILLSDKITKHKLSEEEIDEERIDEPIWLSCQQKLQRFVSVLRRQEERKFASSLGSHPHLNAGRYIGNVKLTGAVEVAIRLYASTLQYFHCIQSHIYLNVLVIDRRTSGVDFVDLYDVHDVEDEEWESGPRRDAEGIVEQEQNKLPRRLSLSITYLHPSLLENFGVALYAALHEYSQCVLLNLQSSRSFTSHIYNCAMIDFYATRLLHDAVINIGGWKSGAKSQLRIANNDENFRRFQTAVAKNIGTLMGDEVISPILQILSRYAEGRDFDEKDKNGARPPKLKHNPQKAREIYNLLGQYYTGDVDDLCLYDDKTRSLYFELKDLYRDRPFFLNYAKERESLEIGSADIKTALQTWFNAISCNTVTETLSEFNIREALFLNCFLNVPLVTETVKPIQGEERKERHKFGEGNEYLSNNRIRDRLYTSAQKLARNGLVHSEFADELLELGSAGLVLLRLEGDKAVELCSHLGITYHLSTQNREKPDEIFRNMHRWILHALVAEIEKVPLSPEHLLVTFDTSNLFELAKNVIKKFNDIFVERYDHGYRDSEKCDFSDAAAEILRNVLDQETPVGSLLLASVSGREALVKLAFLLRFRAAFKNIEEVCPIQNEEVWRKVGAVHEFLKDTVFEYFRIRDSQKANQTFNFDPGERFYENLLKMWSMQYALEKPFGKTHELMSHENFIDWFKGFYEGA